MRNEQKEEESVEQMKGMCTWYENAGGKEVRDCANKIGDS